MLPSKKFEDNVIEGMPIVKCWILVQKMFNKLIPFLPLHLD